MKALILGLAFLSAINSWAIAQQAQFTFTLTNEQVQIISDALVEQPYKKVAPLMGVLQTQINNQVAPAKPVEAPKVEEKKE